MGWEEIGTLAAAKLADVVAMAGDLLTDIRASRMVPLVELEGQVVRDEEREQ